MSYIPEGFTAVTPYLLIERPDDFIAFAERALGATKRSVQHDDEGRMTHGEISVEGCVIEMGEPRGDFEPTRMAFHVFVPDPDASYQRALDGGCESTYPVTDHDYGERSGGVRDPWGNAWFFARLTESD